MLRVAFKGEHKICSYGLARARFICNLMSNRKPDNWWESYRSDPIYGPLPSSRGWGNIILAAIVLGGFGLLLAPLLPIAIPLLGVGAGVWLIVWGTAKSVEQDKISRQKRANAIATIEYWLYHRPTDTWVPANGPYSNRAWFSHDWNRWLTLDEIEGRIPFTSPFKTRLLVIDNRNQTKRVWRDECEIWAVQPGLGKKTVTTFAKDDTSFMSFQS